VTAAAGGWTRRLLIGACAVLATLAAAPWLDNPRAASPGSVHPQAVAVPGPEAGERRLPPLDQLTQTRDRPIFFAGRRDGPPPAPPSVLAPPPASALARYRITGVAISGEGRLAMAKDLGTGRLLTLREGETLEGWMVESVTLEHLVLRSGEQRRAVRVGAQLQ
jgi:hypothetical protein